MEDSAHVRLHRTKFGRPNDLVPRISATLTAGMGEIKFLTELFSLNPVARDCLEDRDVRRLGAARVGLQSVGYEVVDLVM